MADKAISDTTIHGAGTELHAHRHAHAYAAIVLEGEYSEQSVDGLHRWQEGDIIVHPPFHEHSNAFGHGKVRVRNIVLPFRQSMKIGYRGVKSRLYLTVADLAAEQAPDIPKLVLDEVEALLHVATPDDDFVARAHEILASAHCADPVSYTARQLDYSREHFSRKFRRLTHVSPEQYYGEMRLRRAVGLILDGASATGAALDAGFSDQSHFCRQAKRTYGLTPSNIQRLADDDRSQ